jgi:hypothetical protein
MWGRIPEKERANWKSSFKRRLGRNDNNNQNNNNNDPNGNGNGNGGNEESLNNNNQHTDNSYGGNPYDYQAMGEPPKEDGQASENKGYFGKFFGAKKESQLNQDDL